MCNPLHAATQRYTSARSNVASNVHRPWLTHMPGVMAITPPSPLPTQTPVYLRARRVHRLDAARNGSRVANKVHRLRVVLRGDGVADEWVRQGRSTTSDHFRVDVNRGSPEASSS